MRSLETQTSEARKLRVDRLEISHGNPELHNSQPDE